MEGQFRSSPRGALQFPTEPGEYGKMERLKQVDYERFRIFLHHPFKKFLKNVYKLIIEYKNYETCLKAKTHNQTYLRKFKIRTKFL